MSSDQYDYESALNSYKERLSEYKDAAERIVNAQDPTEVIRTAADVIGTPLSIELLKEGIKTRYGQSIDAVKKKITDSAQDAINKIKAKITGAKEQVEEQAGRARQAVKSQVEDAQQSVKGRLQGDDEPTEDVDELASAPRGGTFENPLYDPNAADDETTAPEAGADQGGLFTQNVGSEMTMEDAGTITNTYGASEEQLSTMMDILNARVPVGLSNLTDEQFNAAVEGRVRAIQSGQARATQGELEEMDPATRARFDSEGNLLDRPAEETGGLRGDSTLARATRQPPNQPVEPEQEMENVSQPKPPAEPSAANEDVQAGSQVESDIAKNVATVEEDTGAKGADAAFEAESGGKIAPDLLEAGEEGAEAGEGAVAAGEALAETTGAETDGIGAIVGGLVVLGGVLASIFAPHHHEAPPPPPNLSVPALQVGLGR